MKRRRGVGAADDPQVLFPLAFFALLASLLLHTTGATADEVDPCRRQPFRGRCPSSGGASPSRSQFVLRYYLRNGECVSYPYGHCANDPDEPRLFRYKEECEESCVGSAISANRIVQEGVKTHSAGHDAGSSSESAATTTTSSKSDASTNEATYATPTPTYETPRASECQKQRERALASQGNSLVRGAGGGFVPECSPNGDFRPLQCEQDGRSCYCVNADGIEMKNSRATLKSGEPKPDCEKINSAPAPRTNECSGAADAGPCVSRVERWYYDEAEAKCRQFNYSGCGGNGNNYPNEQQCKRRCAPIDPDESRICGRGGHLPLKNAQGALVDCGKTDCPVGYRCQLLPKQAVCCPDTEPSVSTSTTAADVCQLPKERGPCDKFELRFYYNKELSECKYFFWGGCEGNANNFQRVEECESRCATSKSTPSITTSGDTGVTETTTTSITTVDVESSPSNASITEDEGTGTTTLTTTSKAESTLPPITLPVRATNTPSSPPPSPPTTTTIPLPSDRCLHPLDVGSCGAQFVRWYWNRELRKCETFSYSGCNGNGNNFASHEECLLLCHHEAAVAKKRQPVTEASLDLANVCEADIDTGDCSGSFMRYAFDRRSGGCRQFPYGGCGGNGNNFASMAECRKKCEQAEKKPLVPTITTNICEHPIEEGECSGIFQRFGYEGAENECRQFNYGGCGGNGNNFATLAECRTACIKFPCPPEPACDLSRCQLVKDRHACSFCSCPPPPRVPPPTLPPPQLVAPQCPFVNREACRDPCLIFTNRLGCAECVCPSVIGGIDVPTPGTKRPLPPASINLPPSSPFQGQIKPNFAGPRLNEVTAPVPPPRPIPTTRSPPPPIDFVPPAPGDKCTQPVDPGPCHHFVQRWHFNPESTECEQFQYGGCAGNRNHFFTKNECIVHCARFMRHKSHPPPPLPEEATSTPAQEVDGSVDIVPFIPIPHAPAPLITLPPAPSTPAPSEVAGEVVGPPSPSPRVIVVTVPAPTPSPTQPPAPPATTTATTTERTRELAIRPISTRKQLAQHASTLAPYAPPSVHPESTIAAAAPAQRPSSPLVRPTFIDTGVRLEAHIRPPPPGAASPSPADPLPPLHPLSRPPSPHPEWSPERPEALPPPRVGSLQPTNVELVHRPVVMVELPVAGTASSTPHRPKLPAPPPPSVFVPQPEPPAVPLLASPRRPSLPAIIAEIPSPRRPAPPAAPVEPAAPEASTIPPSVIVANVPTLPTFAPRAPFVPRNEPPPVPPVIETDALPTFHPRAPIVAVQQRNEPPPVPPAVVTDAPAVPTRLPSVPIVAPVQSRKEQPSRIAPTTTPRPFPSVIVSGASTPSAFPPRAETSTGRIQLRKESPPRVPPTEQFPIPPAVITDASPPPTNPLRAPSMASVQPGDESFARIPATAPRVGWVVVTETPEAIPSLPPRSPIEQRKEQHPPSRVSSATGPPPTPSPVESGKPLSRIIITAAPRTLLPIQPHPVIVTDAPEVPTLPPDVVTAASVAAIPAEITKGAPTLPPPEVITAATTAHRLPSRVIVAEPRAPPKPAPTSAVSEASTPTQSRTQPSTGISSRLETIGGQHPVATSKSTVGLSTPIGTTPALAPASTRVVDEAGASPWSGEEEKAVERPSPSTIKTVSHTHGNGHRRPIPTRAPRPRPDSSLASPSIPPTTTQHSPVPFTRNQGREETTSTVPSTDASSRAPPVTIASTRGFAPTERPEPPPTTTTISSISTSSSTPPLRHAPSMAKFEPPSPPSFRPSKQTLPTTARVGNSRTGSSTPELPDTPPTSTARPHLRIRPIPSTITTVRKEPSTTEEPLAPEPFTPDPFRKDTEPPKKVEIPEGAEKRVVAPAATSRGPTPPRPHVVVEAPATPLPIDPMEFLYPPGPTVVPLDVWRKRMAAMLGGGYSGVQARMPTADESDQGGEGVTQETEIRTLPPTSSTGSTSHPNHLVDIPESAPDRPATKPTETRTAEEEVKAFGEAAKRNLTKIVIVPESSSTQAPPSTTTTEPSVARKMLSVEILNGNEEEFSKVQGVRSHETSMEIDTGRSDSGTSTSAAKAPLPQSTSSTRPHTANRIVSASSSRESSPSTLIRTEAQRPTTTTSTTSIAATERITTTTTTVPSTTTSTTTTESTTTASATEASSGSTAAPELVPLTSTSRLTPPPHSTTLASFSMDDHCMQPVDPGPCNDYVRRWFYNPQAGRCEGFFFGSCGGNRNNFVEREQCEAKCHREAIGENQLPVRCTRERDAGHGGEYIPKWYFNHRNLRCEQFVYKGLGGNDNQFSRIEDCQQSCRLIPPFTPQPIATTIRAMTTLVDAGTGDGVSKEPRRLIDNEIVRGSANVETVNKQGEVGAPAPVLPLPAEPIAIPTTTTPTTFPRPQPTKYPAEPLRPGVPNNLPTLGASMPALHNYNERGGRPLQEGIRVHVPPQQLPDKPSITLHPKNEKTGIVTPGGLESSAQKIEVLPSSSSNLDSSTTTPEVVDERIPQCPNGLNAMQYSDGRPLMCLPGRSQCPEKSVCYYNGIDFFCCPNEDDPYDVHIFGGYDGEEVKHGYKNFPSSLNIKSIRRSKRENGSSRREQHVPTRVDDSTPRKISPAAQLRSADPRRNNPCIEQVDRGECQDAHLRYFYDISLDHCRLFYYTGCGGNANNFGTQRECETRCKIGSIVTTTERPLPPGRCPNGEQPLGDGAPVLCGNQTDSIGCPQGYFCRMGPPDVCCPMQEEVGASEVAIVEKKAPEHSEIRRKPFISAAGKFDPHHNDHHPAHNIEHDHHLGEPSTVMTTTVAIQGTVGTSASATASAITDSVSTTSQSPIEDITAAGSQTLQQEQANVIQTPPNMCPDGSDGLVDDLGHPRQCGTGFDGFELCPRGYYCSIDPERNGRLCCPLGIQAAQLPSAAANAFARGVSTHHNDGGDQPTHKSPYLGHRPANPGEVVDRGSLPSDPKPSRLSTPKPKHIEKAEKDLRQERLGGILAEIGANPFAQGVATRELGPQVDQVAGGQQAVEPAVMPSGGVEEDNGFGHLMMKPLEGRGKYESDSKYLSGPSVDGNILDYVEIAAQEDPFEAKMRELKAKPVHDKSVCFLRPNEGRECREDEPAPPSNLQFFYSARDRTCKVYFYRGCAGNANRFASKRDCERYCMEK